MSKIRSWSTTAGSNNSAAPDGAPENMAPSGVNDTIREVMAQVRTWYDDAQWTDWNDTPTYVSSASFTIASDVTSRYLTNRRLKVDVGGTDYYMTVLSATYSAPNTTVTTDSSSITSAVSAVSLSILTPTNDSIPRGLSLTVGDITASAMTVSNLTVSGSATINGTLTAVGAVTFKGAVSASGTLAVGGAATFKGAVSASSTLAVGGATTLSSTLTAVGAIVGSSTITIAGAAAFQSTLTASGNVVVGGNLTVSASGVFKSAIHAHAGISASGTIKATTVSATTVNAGTGGITTINATTLNGTLGTAAQPNVTSVGTLSSLAVSGAVTAAGGIATHTGALLKTQIISIGDWNMDATASVQVAHGLTGANIRSVFVSIIPDSGTGLATAPLFTVISGTEAGIYDWDDTNVTLTRITGGYYDSPNYDSTSFNRGFITIIEEI